MSYSIDLASHFSLQRKNYDVSVVISIDGADYEQKQYIMNSIYFDIPKHEYQIHALIPEDNIRTLQRIILFKNLFKKEQNDNNGGKSTD